MVTFDMNDPAATVPQIQEVRVGDLAWIPAIGRLCKTSFSVAMRFHSDRSIFSCPHCQVVTDKPEDHFMACM